jgi:hypothetical protein
MIGAFVWAIGDGWIPPASTGPAPEMTSHDTACMLNPNDKPAEIAITVYFRDREPADPYRATIRARRVLHQRFDDLNDPEPVPHGVDYSVLIRSSVPILVQNTRLDSRQAENALMSTIAFPAGSTPAQRPKTACYRSSSRPWSSTCHESTTRPQHTPG